METCDFAILTVLQEERDAVLARVATPRVLDKISQSLNRTVYSGSIRSKNPSQGSASFRVVVIPLAGMGRVEAAITAMATLDICKPAYVILVGTAGGFATQGVRIGDVLVATEVVDHSLHKVEGTQTQLRPKTYRVDEGLLAAARTLDASRSDPALDSAWTNVHVCFGPMVSGDRIIASSLLVKSLLETDSRLIGVEMEGAGVLAALKHKKDPPGFLMVRGVADLADEAKSDGWTQLACNAAAGFVIDLFASNGTRLFGHAP